MISEIFDRLSTVLERRFLKNAFLPVLVFPLAVAAPVLLQNERADVSVRVWESLPTGAKLFALFAYFSACWFAAAIVASQWRNIIRLYEGYPLESWPLLRDVGKRWHATQRHGMVFPPPDDRTLYLRYSTYPEFPMGVLPTRLGNVMRAAETHALRRYEAETILLWPRLTHVLPRETINDIAEARATLEFLLVLSLWCVGFGLTNVLTAVFFHGAPSIAALLFAFGVLGAYCSYASAIPIAAEYAEHVRCTFELYRLDLLDRLRIPAPKDLQEEREIWWKLCAFIRGGAEVDWLYGSGVSEQVVRIGDIESAHDRGATQPQPP
ncbi:hypothetical protein OHR68_19745 [Spirillospora sp. NBC_00431]